VIGPNTSVGASENGSLSASALLQAGNEANDINSMMRESIKKDVDSLLGVGGLDKLMSQVGASQDNVVNTVNQLLPAMTSVADDLLKGNVPGDVTQAVLQKSGEAVIRNLGRGDSVAAQGLVARDLGLTTLDLQNQGATLANNAAAFAALPINSAAGVSNVVNNFRTDLVNIGDVHQSDLDRIIEIGTIDPTQALVTANSALSDNLNVASSIASRNQQFDLAVSTSELQFIAGMYGADLALEGATIGAAAMTDAADKQASASNWATGVNAVVTVAGGLINSANAISGANNDQDTYVYDSSNPYANNETYVPEDQQLTDDDLEGLEGLEDQQSTDDGLEGLEDQQSTDDDLEGLDL
jgi:hypothetical protein